MSDLPRILAVGEEPPALNPTLAADRASRKGKTSKPKRKAGERFAVFNALVDFTLCTLNRAQIAVWLILYRDTRDGTARTGIADIARRAGCDRSTVFRAVRSLERAGLLKVVYRGGLGKGTSRYRVRPLAKDQ